MKRILLILLFAIITATSFSTLTSCREQKKDTGDKIEDAIDDTGDAIEDAVDDTGDAIEEGVEKIKDSIE